MEVCHNHSWEAFLLQLSHDNTFWGLFEKVVLYQGSQLTSKENKVTIRKLDWKVVTATGARQGLSQITKDNLQPLTVSELPLGWTSFVGLSQVLGIVKDIKMQR